MLKHLHTLPAKLTDICADTNDVMFGEIKVGVVVDAQTFLELITDDLIPHPNIAVVVDLGILY